MTVILPKRFLRMSNGGSKHTQCVNALVQTSKLEIFAKKDSLGWIWAVMRFHGNCASIPSTTNSRMLTVPRHHILRSLGMMLENPATRTHANIQKLINDARGLRAFITKNPDQMQYLEAMTQLFQTVAKDKPLEFKTEPKKRALVLMFLSPDLNRHDSHNIPKAFCDWLQKVKIIANDRHVDAFARRKTDHGITGQSTDIMLIRYPEANKSVDGMMGEMIGIIQSIESKINLQSDEASILRVKQEQ